MIVRDAKLSMRRIRRSNFRFDQSNRPRFVLLPPLSIKRSFWPLGDALSHPSWRCERGVLRGPLLGFDDPCCIKVFILLTRQTRSFATLQGDAVKPVAARSTKSGHPTKANRMLFVSPLTGNRLHRRDDGFLHEVLDDPWPDGFLTASRFLSFVIHLTGVVWLGPASERFWNSSLENLV